MKNVLTNKWFWIIFVIVCVLVTLSNIHGRNVSNKILDEITATYTKEIEEKDKAIKEYADELRKSEERYRTLAKKLQQKEQELNNIKPPESIKEIYERFERAGYKPLPVANR